MRTVGVVDRAGALTSRVEVSAQASWERRLAAAELRGRSRREVPADGAGLYTPAVGAGLP